MVPITIVFMGFINHLITGPHIDMPMMLGFSPCRDRDHPGITKTKPGPPGRPGLYVRRSVTGSDWSSLTLDWSRVEPHIPWRIHGAAIYGNMDPINVSPMLAYIPAPWILWDMAGKIAMPFFSTSLGPWVAVTIRDLEEAVFVFFRVFPRFLEAGTEAQCWWPSHVKHWRSEAFVLATGSDLFSELHLERTNVIRPRCLRVEHIWTQTYLGSM